MHDFMIFVWTFVLDNKFLVYFLPIIICTLGYILISVEDYHIDVKNRDEFLNSDSKNYYSYTPKLTVGLIVGRLIVGFLPLINILVTIFKFLPRSARDVINACDQWLNIPLVPKPKKKAEPEVLHS